MARIVFGDIKECWRQQVLTFTAHGGELRLSRNEVRSQLFGSSGIHLSGSAAADVRIAPASNFAASRHPVCYQMPDSLPVRGFITISMQHRPSLCHIVPLQVAAMSSEQYGKMWKVGVQSPHRQSSRCTFCTCISTTLGPAPSTG